MYIIIKVKMKKQMPHQLWLFYPQNVNFSSSQDNFELANWLYLHRPIYLRSLANTYHTASTNLNIFTLQWNCHFFLDNDVSNFKTSHNSIFIISINALKIKRPQKSLRYNLFVLPSVQKSIITQLIVEWNPLLGELHLSILLITQTKFCSPWICIIICTM